MGSIAIQGDLAKWIKSPKGQRADETSSCRNPPRLFVLWTIAFAPEFPDAAYHHRLRKLARPRQGTSPRHAGSLGAGRGRPVLRCPPRIIQGDEGTRPSRPASVRADSDL